MGSLKQWLLDQGLSADGASVAAVAAASAALLIGLALIHFVSKLIVSRLIRRAVGKTKTTWDDALVQSRVFSRAAHLVPAVVLYSAAPEIYKDYPDFLSLVRTGNFVYAAIVGMTVIDSLLNAALAIYGNYSVSHRVPIKSFVQVAKIVVWCLGGIAILAILFGRSPLVLLSGLGAFGAVLMLVFKDAILGLVAGIQLAANNMVRRGDWIEMPSQGADGDVIDVSLTTVKIQNWDKTITTVPTYALVAESFKNWRGMEESGGRRIKRSVYIDVTSIKFCDREMLDRFKRIQFIAEYVTSKLEQLKQYNQEKQVDESLLINGRHLTNVGTFRAYLVAYLRNHPKIHKGMTLLIRQLPPTEKGLPIEIYVFSSDQAWARYEAVQADIFDHILAVLPLFDLRVFQLPTGADLRVLGSSAGGVVGAPPTVGS